MTSFKIRDMAYISLFVVLITVGAKILIPVPVCPFTLQLLFTTLAGTLLGAKRGSMAVFIYIILGLLGVPVFSSGGGLGYIFQPSFGYLIGFLIASFVTGAIVGPNPIKVSFVRILLACFIGLFIVYFVGMTYLYMINTLYLGKTMTFAVLFLYCFVLAVPGDIVLCILASVLTKRLARVITNTSEGFYGKEIKCN